MYKRLFIIMIMLCLVLTALPVNAKTIYDFTEQEYNWTGENENFDILNHDPDEEAYIGKLYNLGWAGRYGGIAIIGKELELSVSSSKNRFLKMMVKTDEFGAENAFDKFSSLYWYKDEEGEANVQYNPVSLTSLSALKGNTGYMTITIDLGWENEAETIIGTFRMEMFSSSLDKAASPTDGADCGFIYIKYIGFFDTQEEADQYDMVLPTAVPATPVPEATEALAITPKATGKITDTATVTPDTDASQQEFPVVPALVGGIFAAAAIAIVLIIVIPKVRKR